MKEQLKQILKNVTKSIGKKIFIPLTASATILVLISGSAYVVKLDDGTYKEGDESNTQYVASEFINSTTIDSDGKITPNTTVKELWEKLKEQHSRVTKYLREPEELAKLINAEMVTQYLDTRDNPDEEIDWDKAIDINSNKIQGIIKLKRADSDGKTSTMTYVDPETFQSYIDDYNESGSKSDRDKAMKYFTLEAASSTGDITSETTGQLETIDGVDMKVLTKSGKVTFYNGDGSAIEGGSNDRHGELLADGKVASRGLAPDRSIIYIRTQKSGEGSFANGKFFYVCDTGGGLASNQIDVYAKVTQSKLIRAPYGSYNGKASMYLVKSNATWKEYLNKYYNKTVEGSTSSSNTKNNNDSKENTKNDNDKTLCWPTDGTTISSEFGLRNSTSKKVSRDHRGIDISVSEGTNVYACEDGKVITATNSKTAGNWVVIDHGNGYVSKYMHNSKLEVSAGDTVKKGQIIAKSGNTGNSTGPHVHFQIEYNKKAVDPMNFKYNNNQGDGTSGFGSDVENAKSTKQTYVAKVATWEETTDTLKSTDPSVTTYDNASHNMTTTDINYQDFVKGYTMPFDYLWDLLVMSEDRSFVLDLVDLVLNSKLEITVHDNLTTDTNENIYTYTKKKKTETEATVKVWAGSIPGQQSQSKTKSGNWTDEESNSYKTTHTVVTKTNTLATSLTLADTWIVKYTKDYKYETPKADVTKTKNNIDDDSYGKNADSTNDGKDTYGHAAKLLEELKSEYKNLQYTDGVITSEKEKIYNAIVNQEENITDTVETKKYVEQPKKLEEKTDPDAKEPNFVTIFLKNKRAKHKILSAPSWLYKMLKRNEKTTEMIDLTKYLLYKATQNTKFWDEDKEFDFSIFDPDNFASNAEDTSSGIDGIPGQIFDFLLNKGVPPAGAAAILGNIENESSFDPTEVNSIGCSGLAQWYKGRLEGLKNYAKSKGKEWTDVEIQMEYLWKELNSKEYIKIKNVIMATTEDTGNTSKKDGLQYATWFWGRYYEVYFTGKWEKTRTGKEQQERYKDAQKWYKEYQEKHTGGTEINGSSISVANGTAKQKLAYLFPSGVPTTKSGCEKYLANVQVAMTSKDGKKYTGTIRIHKSLAKDVQDVFQIAQNAGFRIYSAGGYSFRRMNNGSGSKLSHHSYGVAIDINPNENYSHRGSTVYAGSFWSPQTSQYSIPKNGTLVKAFKSKGWKWGGEWSGNYQDYMHFSFTGN